MASIQNYYVCFPGIRFGLTQTKVGIVSILSKYEVRVSKKTPIHLEFDPRSIVLAPVGGMWLDIVNRSDASSQNS
jgi:cytochrome P450 family 6